MDRSELLISGYLLDDPTVHRFKNSEVLINVEKVCFGEETSNQHLLTAFLCSNVVDSQRIGVFPLEIMVHP